MLLCVHVLALHVLLCVHVLEAGSIAHCRRDVSLVVNCGTIKERTDIKQVDPQRPRAAKHDIVDPTTLIRSVFVTSL